MTVHRIVRQGIHAEIATGLSGYAIVLAVKLRFTTRRGLIMLMILAIIGIIMILLAIWTAPLNR